MPCACPVEERTLWYASLPDALSSYRVDITLTCREVVEDGDHRGRGAGGTHPPLAHSRALCRAGRLRAGLYRPGALSAHTRAPARRAARTRGLPRGYLGQWVDHTRLCRDTAHPLTWGEWTGRGGCAGDRRDEPGNCRCPAAGRRPA